MIEDYDEFNNEMAMMEIEDYDRWIGSPDLAHQRIPAEGTE